MKRRIFSILFALVLVLSFSLVTGPMAGTVEAAGTAKDYQDKAIEMGDWLVNNQAAWTSDGSYTFYQTAPNILALALLYEETGDSTYLTAAENAADFVTTHLQLMDETISEGWTFGGASGMDFTPETWDDAYGLIMRDGSAGAVAQFANAWGLGEYALALKKLNELTGNYSSNLDAIKHWYETYTHGSPETNYDGLIYKRMSGYNDRVAYPMQHGVIPPNSVYHTYGDNPYPFKLWTETQGISISVLLRLGNGAVATELGDWLVDPDYGWNTTEEVFNSFYDFDIDQPNWDQNNDFDYGVVDGTDNEILIGLLELYQYNPDAPNASTYKQRCIDAMDYILTTPGGWNENDINNPYYGITASVMLWEATGDYTYLANAKAKGDEYLTLASGDYGWGNGSKIIRLLKLAEAVSVSEVWVDDGWAGLNPGEQVAGHTFGYDAFATIQKGIDNVATGGTVNVLAGIYNEAPRLDKALTVKSTDGAEQTTIDGTTTYIVIISHSDVIFDGFTVTNPDYATSGDVSGVLVEYVSGEPVDNVHILNNIVTQVRSETGTPSMYGATGINIGNAPLSNVVISGNTITDIKNPEGGTSDHTCGINVWDGAQGVVISNNTISDIKYNGIILEHASNVLIENNPIITGCETGIRVEPFEEGNVSDVTINSNSFADNSIQVFDGAFEVLDIEDVLANNTFDRAVTVDRLGASLLHTIWSKIQDGITAASEGDTIIVATGTYKEHITIDKSNLNLMGENKETTIIDATQDSSWPVAKPGILIGEYPLVDGVHSVTVSGFTIRDAAMQEGGAPYEGNKYGVGPGGLAGIQIYNSNSNIIEDNILINNYWQIWLVAEWPTAGYTECMNNRIANNIIMDSENDGVYLYSDGGVYVENTEIVNNEISNAYGDSASGIEFWGWPEGGLTPTVSGTVISSNLITGCTYGVRIKDVSDITGTSVNYNNIVGNTNGIYNGVTSTIDATHNWWGDASGPGGVGLGTGDAVSTNVDYTPWITGEVELGAFDSADVTGTDPGEVDLQDDEGNTIATVDISGGDATSGTITGARYTEEPEPDGTSLAVGTDKTGVVFLDVYVTGYTSGIAHITVPYPDDDQDGIVDGTTIDETTLGLYCWDDASSMWRIAANNVVDPNANTVSGDIPVGALTGTPLGLAGYPADEATVVIGDITVGYSGNDTVDLIITTKTAQLGAVTIDLTFDNTVVEVLGGENSDFDSLTVNPLFDTGKARFVANQLGVTGVDATVGAVLAQVRLKAVGTTGSSSPLTLDVITLKDNDGVSIPYVTPPTHGTATIGGLGDANSDGAVDVYDCVYIARAIAKIPGYIENSSTMDVDGKDGVDAFDCTYLARHLAGIPGYELGG